MFASIDYVYTLGYTLRIRFEWDEDKNQQNHAKHGVWFEEAQTLWVDPLSIEFFDPDHSDDEDRFIRVGHSALNRILLVVFCERRKGASVRIISARNATRSERHDYEEELPAQ